MRDEWGDGIRYRRERLNTDGSTARAGFRLPQLGASMSARW
jgi:hypothetical protein